LRQASTNGPRFKDVCLGAPCRSNSGSRSGRPATDHQYVSLGEHRQLAFRHDNRFRRALALREGGPLEKFDPDRGANAVGIVAALVVTIVPTKRGQFMKAYPIS
jgi:hypothetical protein